MPSLIVARRAVPCRRLPEAVAAAAALTLYADGVMLRAGLSMWLRSRPIAQEERVLEPSAHEALIRDCARQVTKNYGRHYWPTSGCHDEFAHELWRELAALMTRYAACLFDRSDKVTVACLNMAKFSPASEQCSLATWRGDPEGGRRLRRCLPSQSAKKEEDP